MLCLVMLSAIYAEGSNKARNADRHYADRHYAERHDECWYDQCQYDQCLYAECRYADCLGALKASERSNNY
jgi:hypothetical protein